MLGIQSKKGFTLIEMVVVLAIIGVLSSISFTSYTIYHKRARMFSAKKTMSSILIAAQTFKTNSGFYLPNYEEMHIPLKGIHDYSFFSSCLTETGTSYSWDDRTKACGKFDENNTYDATAKTWTTTGNTKCWMGYVLYHSYSKEHAGDFPPWSASEQFECTSVGDDKEDVDFRGPDKAYRGIVLFPDRGSYSSPAVEKFFKVKDTKDLCDRESRKTDIFQHTGKDCIASTEYAVHHDKFEDIITAELAGSGAQKKKFYLSSPNRFVIHAVACAKGDDDCGGGASKNQAYHIMTINSQKIAKDGSGSANI